LRTFLSQERRKKALIRPLEAREGREAVKSCVTVWRPWQLKQLELFHAVAVSTSSRQHFTQEYQLIYIQSGAVHYQSRNTHVTSQVVDGQLLVFEPGDIWISQLKDVTYHRLVLDPAWLQRRATEMLHWEKSLPHFLSHALFDPSLSQALRDLTARSLAPASRQHQEEPLLHRLASLLLSHAQGARALPQPAWEHPAIKRTKEYLEAHYAQEVALQELADVVNLSPFHLSRVFHQAVGLPPHVYQTKLRLARAKTLLAQGCDVGFVAHETGFFDQSHFTQQFKRHYLVTPGSYCKTARFS
jgi:AraC-like DNA-binding protein